MQPYEFGYRVGVQLEKRALFGETGDEIAFGTGGAMGQFDPTQRGLVQDVALYSNPITGVPTAINDTTRHLYNGRFGQAGLSVLNGALSFLPGFGFAAGAAGRAGVSAGRALARAGMKQTGRALSSGSVQFVDRGRKMMTGVNQAMSKGVQKVAPLAQNPGVGGKVWNAAIKNPMQTMQMAPLATTAGSLAGMAMGAGGQPMQPMQPPQLNNPMMSF
jgi:hypothetical protein